MQHIRVTHMLTFRSKITSTSSRFHTLNSLQGHSKIFGLDDAKASFTLASFPWQVFFEKIDNISLTILIPWQYFLDKCPCSKTGRLVFEQGQLSRAIFASVNDLPSALVKENLSYFPFTLPRKTCQRKTCQGELASVYSQQVFLDKGICQGKLASVNEA